MTNKLFEQQVHVFLQYLEEVWQRADELPQKKAPQSEIDKFSVSQKADLRESLTELKSSLGTLQAFVEELYKKNHELTVNKKLVEIECNYYQELFEYAPDACLVTTNEGEILEANQKAIQLLNISPKRLIGKPLVIFIAAEERQLFYYKINQLQKGESFQNWQVKIQRQRGVCFTTLITVSPIQNQQGSVKRLRWRILEHISSSTPINNERLVEENDYKLPQKPINHLESVTEPLSMSIAKIGSILDTFFATPDDFFLICSKAGEVIFASSVAPKVLQLPLQELLGKNWHQLNFTSDVATKIAAQQKQLLDTEKILNGQVEILLKEETISYQYTIKNISQVNSYPEVTIATFQRLAQSQQVKSNTCATIAKEITSSHSKSNFTSIFIDKLRNPLNNILDCNKLLENDLKQQLNPKQALYIQQLKINIKLIHQLLEDLILMDKIETRKIQLKPSLIDLTEFCRRLIKELQEGVIDSQDKITLIKQGKPCGVWDEKLLRQTLSNLLISAIKYSLKGSEIELEVICQGKQIIFNIQIDNSEISHKEQRLILDDLNQNQETNVSVIEEKALRLLIAKECVKIQKGDIFLECKKSVTIFTVKLPLNQRVEKKNRDYKSQ